MMKERRAVLVSLEKTQKGKIKISLDDLIQSDVDPLKWIKDVPITSKEYNTEMLEALEFNNEELSEFGYYIIARLYAFYKECEI